MPVSCPFQGCKVLLRIVKQRCTKYHAFATPVVRKITRLTTLKSRLTWLSRHQKVCLQLSASLSMLLSLQFPLIILLSLLWSIASLGFMSKLCTPLSATSFHFFLGLPLCLAPSNSKVTHFPLLKRVHFYRNPFLCTAFTTSSVPNHCLNSVGVSIRGRTTNACLVRALYTVWQNTAVVMVLTMKTGVRFAHKSLRPSMQGAPSLSTLIFHDFSMTKNKWKSMIYRHNIYFQVNDIWLMNAYQN